jgi:tRNA nucleotidyltransferase/poly(A) polymerase
VPTAVAAVLDRLAARGEVWLVGGAVLGWLSGQAAPDVDAIAALDADALAAAGGVAIGGRFGTHAWRNQGALLEVSPLRGQSLADDLAARDFSIHAIAARWPDGRICDPCGGRRDRETRLLRAPQGAATFAADPLRILRGWRRVAHGRRWHGPTLAAARQALPALRQAPPERQGPEWLKLLVGAHAGSTLRAMGREPGLLEALHPVLGAMNQPPPPPRHAFNPWVHTSHVVAALPAEAALRLAGLFHDSGKALPRLAQDSPWPQPAADAPPWHLSGHAAASRAVLARTAAQWALPTAIADRALRLVAAHTFDPQTLCEDAVARRVWIAANAPDAQTLVTFLRADYRATGRGRPAPILDQLTEQIARDEAAAWPRRPADLPIDAAALFGRLGIQGAARSRLLEALWHWVLADPAERQQSDVLAGAAERISRDLTRPPDRS